VSKEPFSGQYMLLLNVWVWSMLAEWAFESIIHTSDSHASFVLKLILSSSGSKQLGAEWDGNQECSNWQNHTEVWKIWAAWQCSLWPGWSFFTYLIVLPPTILSFSSHACHNDRL
jgi:hypothetical protein